MEGPAADRYKILDTVCEGRAYKAFDREQMMQVFLKRWDPGDGCFDAELQNLSRLDNPYFPKLLNSFENGEGRFIVTRWIDGTALDDLVGRSGPMKAEAAAEVIIKICDALSFLHWDRRGATAFIDLKPSNVLLCGNGKAGGDPGRASVSLVDFEAAVRIVPDTPDEGEPEKKRTMRLGSRFFTAPEVLFGNPSVKSDIYSLGVLMGYLLTGTEAYPNAYSMRGFAGDFIAKCTDPDPEKRFDSVRAVSDSLRDFLNKMRAGPAAVKKTETNAGSEPGPANRIIREAANYRRSCVMVEGNACFVSEMGTASSEGMGLRTGVFSISERGRRNIEYYFSGAEKAGSLVAEKTIYPYVFDHKSMYLHDAEEWESRGLLKRWGGAGLLYRGTFKQCLELPLRRSEDVKRFVEWCFCNFDVTLINVERSDEPSVKNAVMENCNYVVATPESNVEDMESFRNYYLALAENGRLVYSKVRFVAWDYADSDSNRDRLFKVVGKDRYLGEVFRSETRTRKKNRVDGIDPFLPDDAREQYEGILERLIS